MLRKEKPIEWTHASLQSGLQDVIRSFKDAPNYLTTVVQFCVYCPEPGENKTFLD